MRRLLAPFLAMSLLMGMPSVAQDLAEPEIWFNPHGPGVDLLDMWTNDAPWQEAAKKVKVLVLVHWWIARQTDETLTQVIEFAKKRHMELDISTEPINWIPEAPCGANIEGYMSASELEWEVQRMVRLGAKVDWVDMDGPLVAGSYIPYGCRYSIPDLVTHVVETLSSVVKAFPGVKIMEVEPLITLTQTPTWREDETAFHIGLAQQLGRPVQTMQADIQWQLPAQWKPAMRSWVSYLRSQNMGFSVIYNGTDATAQSDADWINSEVANVESVEGDLQIIPDQILFTAWSNYPSHNMPETSPTAQTWLINRYFRPRSALQVQFVGQGAHGKLTTIDGKPIPNATVNGYKPGVDFRKPLPVTVVTGVVPTGAVGVVVGARVNAECSCEGINDLLLGALTYHEIQGGSVNAVTYPSTTFRIENGATIDGETVGGTRVSRIISFPGQGLTLNMNYFPVTPNAHYQFSIPVGTIGGSGWYGNVVLIFVSATAEVGRVPFTPGPGKALVSTTTTRADGTFELFPLPRSVDGPLPVTVEFDGGGGAYRSTVWSPLH